jgi:WD40 repeat protein
VKKIIFLTIFVSCLFVALRAEETPAFIELKHVQEGIMGFFAQESRFAPMTTPAFSNDGKKVVTVENIATIRIWDTDSGSANYGKALKMVGGLPRNAGQPYRVIFSPDGKTLATAGGDKVARILDIEAGKMVQEFKGHEGPIMSIAFSPDGTKLVTGSYDKTARVWDIESGKELQKLEGHTGFVTTVAFSPNGKEVLTTGSFRMTATVNKDTFESDDDRTARIWTIPTGEGETGKELKQLDGYKKDGFGLRTALSHDWRIVAAERSRGVGIYDAESGVELHKLADDREDRIAFLRSLAFSPDGRRLAIAGSDQTRIYDVESGVELGRYTVVVGNMGMLNTDSVVFSPNGKKLMTIPFAARSIHIWDVEALLRPNRERPAIMDF